MLHKGLVNILPIANGGTGTASPGLVAGTNVTITGTWPNQTITSSATAATAFSAITGSTNTGQALVIGAGSSLAVTGGGTIAATSAPFSGLTGNLSTTQGPTALTGVVFDTAGTLSVAAAGTVYLAPNGSSAALSVATTGAFGVVKPDGTTITVSGGVISSATASLADCTDTPGTSFVCTVPIGVNATGVPSQMDFTPSGTSPAAVAGAASIAPPNSVSTAGVYLLPAAPASGFYTGANSGGVVTTTFTATNGSGNAVLTTSPTLVTPILGAATATSLLATGTLDGTAGTTVTTGTTATLNAFLSGYWWNAEATAATAVAYTLPTAAAGLQKCVGNSWNALAPTTGILTVNTSASGQFIIFTDGTLSATGGNVTSGGAAADAACFVGVDSTHWQMNVVRGSWAKH